MIPEDRRQAQARAVRAERDSKREQIYVLIASVGMLLAFLLV